MSLGLKIPTKTLADNFDLQDFKDDFNTLEAYAEQMKTILDTWETFKANGGTVGGDVITDGEITFRGGGKSKIIAPSDGWFGIQASNGTNPPSTLYYDPRNEGSNCLYSNKTGGVDLGYKSFHPFRDLWLGTYSQSTNGYTKLPNGLIMQWGTYYQSTGIVGQKLTLNFPISFPNAVLSVSPTVTWGSPNSQTLTMSSPTKTSFAVIPNTNDPFTTYWIAIGY